MRSSNNSKVTYWQERVKEWSGSGQSSRKWCQDNGITYNKFLYWKKRLQEKTDISRGGISGFIELPAEQSSAVRASILISVGPFQVSVDSGFDESSLSRLLAIMGRMV